MSEIAITLPIYRVRIPVFCAGTGYTPDAVDKKIRTGVWKEGIHYFRAPDGHIVIDLEAYHKWVAHQDQAA